MRNSILAFSAIGLLTFTVITSCEKENIKTEKEEKFEISTTTNKSFIHVDEETDCEGYTSIIPSGNGITGTFTINTVLPYFYTNHDPMNGEAGCSYITFTGNYNKSTSTLSSIVKSYFGDWVYAGWIRHKYQISATDMWWLPRAEPNTFRLVFNMDHIYQRRDGSGTYTDYQILSDGRYVDFVVE